RDPGGVEDERLELLEVVEHRGVEVRAGGGAAHRLVQRRDGLGVHRLQHAGDRSQRAPGPAEQHRAGDLVGPALELDRLREPDAGGELPRDGEGDDLRVEVVHQFSRIATTPWPPAAQMLITPRPEPRSFSALASEATSRPPVAANGGPAASEA